MKPCFEMQRFRPALLAKLVASTDDAGVKSTIKSALALVKEKGLGEMKAETAVKA